MESVLAEVSGERQRQDEKWGGPLHDDEHSTAEFVQWIEDYAGWARMMASMKSMDKARRRLIQVAALAVAAVESLDRKEERRKRMQILPLSGEKCVECDEPADYARQYGCPQGRDDCPHEKEK
jgi:hypothetical protein